MLVRYGSILILLVFVSTGVALAQQRPGGNGPLPGDPGYNNSAGYNSPAGQGGMDVRPPRPSGQWINTWGAIANGSNGEGGISIGMPTKEAAEDEAVVQCIRGGGKECRPTMAYDQCIAILKPISNGIRDFFQAAESVEVATTLGIPKCKAKNNGSECEVVYSACSDPIFRSF